MSGFDGLHGWLGTEALSVRPSLSLYEWIKAVPYTEEKGDSGTVWFHKYLSLLVPTACVHACRPSLDVNQ